MRAILKNVKFLLSILFVNCLYNPLYAIPTKEEAMQQLRDQGVSEKILATFEDIKCNEKGIRIWISWYACIPSFAKNDRSVIFDIYYYWLVVGLRQLNPFNSDEYVYIQQVLACTDKLFKQSRERIGEDLLYKFAELKFMYLFGEEVYTDSFKNYALQKLKDKTRIFPTSIINALSRLDSSKNPALIFRHALSCIYNRCDDPEKEATELMFYLIGITLYYVNAYTASLNKCVNDAFIELEKTEDLLLDLTGCSFEKLMSMFRAAKEREIIVHKERKVQFGGETSKEVRIRSFPSCPLTTLPGILKQQPQSL